MVPFSQRKLQEADAALMSAALKLDSTGKIATDSQKRVNQLLNEACLCAVGVVPVAAMDWPISLPAEHVALYRTAISFLAHLIKEKKNYVTGMLPSTARTGLAAWPGVAPCQV